MSPKKRNTIFHPRSRGSFYSKCGLFTPKSFTKTSLHATIYLTVWLSDYFLWKEYMAHITRIKAGQSGSKNSEETKASGKNPEPKKPIQDNAEIRADIAESETYDKKSLKNAKKLAKLEKKAEKLAAKKAKKASGEKSKNPLIRFLLFITTPIRAFFRYLAESWQELKQVRWPNRKMTWKLVFAVILYTVIFAAIIMVLDALFTLLFNNLLK